MKLYYKYNKYDCKIKTEMKPNDWGNFEPVKLTVTLPLINYFKMLTEINECDKEFHFKILLNKKDNHNCISFGKDGLWSFDSRMSSSTITSRFSKGVVNVIFRLSLFSADKENLSEIRELIINDLFKREKGE